MLLDAIKESNHSLIPPGNELSSTVLGRIPDSNLFPRVDHVKILEGGVGRQRTKDVLNLTSASRKQKHKLKSDSLSIRP